MLEFENMLHNEFTSLVFKITFYLFVFVFGICIGSFLNVVIIRLPRGESLIKRSSHCMTCGTKIRANLIIRYCLMKTICCKAVVFSYESIIIYFLGKEKGY